MKCKKIQQTHDIVLSMTETNFNIVHQIKKVNMMCLELINFDSLSR